MRIIIVNTAVFPVGKSGAAGYSGLEHLAWLQAKGLAEKGHKVTLIAAEGSECPGVEVLHVNKAGSWDEKDSYNRYWQRLVECNNGGCIIDNTWNKYSYILKMEGRLHCPVLGVLHAPVNTMYQSLPPVDKPCFVCISQDQANHFEALFSRPAKVAYNGVDVDQYQSLNIPRSNRFLFLARFSSIKGPVETVEACLKAGVGLDMVGDVSITNEPETYQRCKQLADASNGQIRIVGPCSRGECVWWFSQAHCLLHVNKNYREPLGLAPIESMLCGTPVIAWRYGALKETVKEGVSGYLVESMDELVSVINAVKQNPFYMGSNREECRKWATRFSVQAMIDRYETLALEAVIKGGW